MIILIDAEKTCDETQYSFLILKKLSKLGMQGYFFSQKGYLYKT